MLTYDARIVTHTVSKLGNDIVTFEATLPKYLVAEFNTHKIEIERNSASSRAVPTHVIIDTIVEYPVLPIDWRSGKGMHPSEILDDKDVVWLNRQWLELRDMVIDKIQNMMNNTPSGKLPDKQRLNRALETWMWTKIVCTMTGGGKIGIPNYFYLQITKTNYDLVL